VLVQRAQHLSDPIVLFDEFHRELELAGGIVDCAGEVGGVVAQERHRRPSSIRSAFSRVL
jgi:hypothetical protein